MPVINRDQHAEGIYKAIFVGLIFTLLVFGATIAVAITAQDYRSMSGDYSHCFDEIDGTAWETAITDLEHLSNGQNWNLSDEHRNDALQQGLNFADVDINLFQRQFRDYLQPCINICLQSNGQIDQDKSEFDPTAHFRIQQNSREWYHLIQNWAVQYCQQIAAPINILENLRKDCIPVPNLIGKTYGEAQNYLLVGLPEKQRFSSDLLVIEGNKRVRYGFRNPKVMNLKVIEQVPVAGVLVDRVMINLAVKLEPLTIEKIEIKALGKPILSPGESLKLKADVLFSNGERKDVTLSAECVWKSEEPSIILVENGKATLGKGIPQKSSYTVSAKYSYMDTTVESAAFTIEVSKEKASCLRLEVLGPKELWSSYEGPRVKVILIHSDNSEEDVTDGDKTRLETKPKEVWLGNTPGEGLQIGAWFPDGSKLKKIHIRGVHARNNDLNDLIYSDWVEFHLRKGHVIVPRIGDQRLEEAKKTLRSYGFSSIKPLNFSHHGQGYCSNMKNEGRAYSSSPGPGQIADPKATIEIWMDGSVVPDIVGMSESDAENAVQAKDLKFKTMQYAWFKPEYKAGHVIAQGPKAGECLRPGELVVATLNGSPIPVNIPDLIGKSEEEARSIIKSVSLVPSVKTAKKWVRGGGDGIVVDQNPSAGQGQTALPSATITVWLNPPLPSIGIIIKPDKRSYQPGATIKFKQNVKRKNPNNSYTFKWEADGKPVATGEEFTYTFDQPGRHYVQLILESSDPQENDAIIKNIGIEYPPDLELGIRVIPSGPYIPGQQVELRENCKNVTNHPKYNWYFGFFNDKIRSGRSINYKLPDEKGTYTVTLGLRFGSDNFDSLKKTITVTVGDPAIKPLGRWRNKFRAEGPMTNLRIQSSEWQTGFTWSQGIGNVKTIPAKWKDWVMVRNLDSVEGYDLYTGQQAGGHNSGFLVYLPSGSEKLQYKVFGYNFNKHKGVLNHEGYLNMRGKVPDPQSIRWIDKRPRAGVVQWQTTDGSICKARIWKIKANVYIRGGVDDLGCGKGPPPSIAGYVPASDPGMGGSSSGTGQANKIGQQFQNSIASTGTSSGSGQGGMGNLTNVTVSQQDITVTLWDHGKEDGDIINIYLNGQLFKGNVRLTNAKKKFQVKLNSGNNTFEVEAVNEGSIPPNTASVRISHVTSGRGTQIYERKSGKRASMNLSAP